MDGTGRGRGQWLSGAALVAAMVGLCCAGGADSGGREGTAMLSRAGIDQIAFISRAERINVGDVFQYTSFKVDSASANIYKLGTVSGGATPVAITPFGTGSWARADVMAMDISFDGQEIVFSARLEEESSYGIWRIKIDGTNPEEPGEVGPTRVYSGPFDAVFPIYLPNERIFFMTNETVGPGIKQFRDEYERGLTAQAATMNIQGGDMVFGPRNLSHRVSPSLMVTPDGKGQILHTNWDHLARVNEGNLMVMNPDMSGAAEFYGKEGSGVANSYLKARQINDTQFLAISTSRDRTFQSGSIIKITRGKNESGSAAEIITPDVPTGRDPSFDKIGRYYDAYPITNEKGDLTHILTSWANGPVQTDIAGGGMNEDGVDYGMGSGPPDFGIYVLNPATGERLPVFNAGTMWDVMPMEIGRVRREPTSPAAPSAKSAPEGTGLIGALNVHESSLGFVPDGGAERVRIIEGFSVEEGVPNDFGLTDSEGAILLGEAEVKADGSFAAHVPEDRPIHLQLVDAYGMSMVNEDRWFSAAAGEQRFCGGCHEERGATSQVDPGLSDAMGEGAFNFALPYEERRMPDPKNLDYVAMASRIIAPDDDNFAGAGRLTGIPWDIALQGIFDDAGCIGCHEGTPGPANPQVSITDIMAEEEVEPTVWTFDLRGDLVDVDYGLMAGSFTRSHISLLLMDGLMMEEGVEVEQVDPERPYQSYMVAQSARDSVLIHYLQPSRIYPDSDETDRAFEGQSKWDGSAFDSQHPHEGTAGFDASIHRALTAGEKYLLILAADMGAQYYSLENVPGRE